MMNQMDPSVSNEGTKVPPSPANRKRRRILWYVVTFGILLVFYVSSRNISAKADRYRAMIVEVEGQEIATSVERFFNEYGYLPVPEKESSSLDAGFVTDEELGVEVLRILTGKDQDRNPKDVPFFRPHEGKDRKGGLIYEEGTGKIMGLFDAWGNPYQLVFDTDYSEDIVVSIMGKEETVPGQRVIAYSAGKDRKLGTADDFRSWVPAPPPTSR